MTQTSSHPEQFSTSQDFITSRHLSGFHENFEFQPLVFSLLPQKFSVCRLPVNANVQLPLFDGFLSFTRSEQEISIVCSSGAEPEGSEIETNWRAMRIEQQLNFNLIGILARISSLLAWAKISIFVVSTYNTDYFLVKEQHIDHAIETLKEAQYKVIT